MLKLFNISKHVLHHKEFWRFHLQKDSDLERSQFYWWLKQIYFWLLFCGAGLHISSYIQFQWKLGTLSSFFEGNLRMTILEIRALFFQLVSSWHWPCEIVFVKHVVEKRDSVRAVANNGQLVSVVYQPLILLLTPSFWGTEQRFCVAFLFYFKETVPLQVWVFFLKQDMVCPFFLRLWPRSRHVGSWCDPLHPALRFSPFPQSGPWSGGAVSDHTAGSLRVPIPLLGQYFCR